MATPDLIEGRFLPKPESLQTTANSQVWQGVDLSTNEQVAIKRPHHTRELDEARLRREATALVLAGHEGVAPLVAHGCDRQGLYLITRWIDGEQFPVHAIPAPRVTALARELLVQLAGVHELGFVHRDLKPTNIIVSPDQRVWLLDFGIVYGKARFSPLNSKRRRIGTLPYMAPEQMDQGTANVRTDLYSVGLLLFQALSGRHPFGSRSNTARIHHPAPRTKDVRPDAPDALANLIDALLTREPDARPASAREALALLEDGSVQSSLMQLQHLPELLSRKDLENMIDGPERALHLRTDASRDLFRRSGGHRDSVIRVLADWASVEGVELLEDGRVRLSRSSLLRCMARSNPHLSGHPRVPLMAREADLLRFVALARGTIDRDQLIGVSDFGDEVPEMVARLIEDGLVVDDRGLLSATLRGEASAAPWSEDRFQQAHRALAEVSEPSSWPRLLHGIAGSLLNVIDTEVVGFAEGCQRSGKLDLACRALQSVLERYGSTLRTERRIQLLVRMVCASCATEASEMRDLAQRLVRESRVAPPYLVELADASAQSARRGVAAEPARLQAMGELANEDLEQLRVAMMVGAPEPDTQAWGVLVGSLADWADRHPERKARWLGWQGLLAYRRRQYEQSMVLHRQARIEHPEDDDYARLRTLVHEAGAAAEQSRTADRAVEVAREAIALASRLRLPGLELRGWTFLRSVAYRRGEATEVDMELVEAARRSGIRRAAANLLLVEGVIAWRAGANEAADLLSSAREQAQGNDVYQRLCDALLVRIRRISLAQVAVGWGQRLREEPHIQIAAQLWTLLASAGLDLEPPAGMDDLVEDDPDWRFEVLSLSEIRQGRNFLGPGE